MAETGPPLLFGDVTLQSLEQLAARDSAFRGFEFCSAVRAYAAQRGQMSNALDFAEQIRAPERARMLLRAAVGAGSTSLGSPSAWMGDELVSYKPLAEGFFSSLRSRSVFFRLLGDSAFARVPMRTKIAVQVSAVTGSMVRPGQPKPVSRLDLSAAALEPRKAVAQVVVSEELLSAIGAAAEAAFGRELRGAVADTVDGVFFDAAGQGLTPQAATASPLADLETLLSDVNTTGAGRLYWALRPSVANTMSALAVNGNRLFPEMTPLGGQLLGLPAVVSTQVPAAAGSPAGDALWLLDASGIAADSAEIEVRMSREAVVEMETAPTGDAVGAVPLGVTARVSLWQQNLVAFLAEVRFAAYRYRPNAVAVLEGINW